MYTEQSLVRIAKRENNNKRNYLVINRLQGKHIPVRPHEALAMFHALADKVRSRYKSYQEDKLLVIGFAETATAIGAAVASELGADYMQTTRESVPDVEYLYFSEEHSHAVEQKLVKNDIDSAIETLDRILFVEDEVTTGKTIRNIIALLRKQYPQKIKFCVASILNGMDKEALDIYAENEIDLIWLIKTNHAAYAETADSYKDDGTYVRCRQGALSVHSQSAGRIYLSKKRMDSRRIVHSAEYHKFCESVYLELVSRVDFGSAQNILVLGTEEFMYPALYAAGRLETQGKNVLFHATTRSPIAVSVEQNYPLHTRYELKSLYDCSRTIYIYDLQKYDIVVIITDAAMPSLEGIETLYDAVCMCGNERVYFCQLQL